MSMHRPSSLRHRDDTLTTNADRPLLWDTAARAIACHLCAERVDRSTTADSPIQERYRTTDHHRPPYYNCHLRAYRAVVDAEQTQNDQGSLPRPIRVWHSSRKVHPLPLPPELCVVLESAFRPDSQSFMSENYLVDLRHLLRVVR